MTNDSALKPFPGVEHELDRLAAEVVDFKVWEEQYLRGRAAGVHLPGLVSLRPPGSTGDSAQFHGPKDQNVQLKTIDNPDPTASVGFVGSAALVECNQSLIEGVLVLPIRDAEAFGIAADSVRVFRWEPAPQGFSLVARSRAGNGFAVAELNTPGIYVAVGLPRDPVASRLIKLGWILSDLAPSTKPGLPGAVMREVGATLAKELEPIIQSRESVLALPEPDAPNPDLPDYAKGDTRVDRARIIETLGRETRLPEYQILSNRSATQLVSDRWRFVGPDNIAGASSFVLVHPSEPDQIFTWSPDGGVWRLTGASGYPASFWEPLTDSLPLQRTQAFAAARSDYRVLYAQMGDERIYRSTNAGGTWTAMSERVVGVASRILVDPRMAARVYVASANGLWRSDDGASSWVTGSPLLAGDVTDLTIDPADFDIVYATVRTNGLWKSSHRGEAGSWTRILAWDPAAIYWTDSSRPVTAMRVALGASGPASARRVVVKFGQQVLYNSTGGVGEWRSLGMVGGPWREGSMNGDDVGQGDFAHCLAVDPFDQDRILVGQDRLYKRRIGAAGDWEVAARYYAPLEESHPDYHGIAFDADQAGVVYVANDGGVYRSPDHGDTWSYLGGGLDTLQVWFQTGISAGTTLCGAYHHGLIGAVRATDPAWQPLGGGAWEFTSAVADEQIGGIFYVFNSQDAASRLSRARLLRTAGSTSGSLELDVIFGGFSTNAVAIDPRPDSRAMLAGGQNGLFRTTNRSTSPGTAPTWITERLALDAGDGIVSIAYAARPSGPATAYVLTTRSVVYRNTDVDAGGVWERRGQWVGADARQLAVNIADPRRIYIVAWEGGLARSEDSGGTFRPVAPGSFAFPPGTHYSAVLTHPDAARALLLATTFGIYISRDEGGTWRQFGVGLPNVQVVFAFVYGREIYAATHGRGLWRHSLR
jgi:hypothetical protein